MGVDYNGQIILGYVLPTVDAQSPFRIKNPGKFHMEDRFNPLNGEKLAPLKVWDEKPGSGLFYKDQEYQMHEDFEQLLEEILDCRVTLIGSWMQGEFDYVFHPEMPSPSSGGYDGGRVSYGPSYWFKDFLSLEIRLKRIKGALKKLGLDPGEPEVKLAVTIS